MPDNVNITVNETIENVVINSSVSTDAININTFLTNDNVNITVNENEENIIVNSNISNDIIDFNITLVNENVNITVNETIENIVINPVINTDEIDVNVTATTEEINIEVTPEITTININTITNSEPQSTNWFSLVSGYINAEDLTPIATGEVIKYTYLGGSIRHRFIATNESEDTFYTTYIGGVLSNPVATKLITL